MRKYSVTVEENRLTYDLPPLKGDEFLVKRLAPAWDDRHQYPEGSLREIWHHHDDGIHCEHRPAVTITYPSGVVAHEQWYRRGRLHRDDAPAEKRFSPDGTLCSEVWYRKGKLHREGGAALVEYDPATGEVMREEWRVIGVLHRQFGPAQSQRNDAGEMEHRFFRQGVEIADPLARGGARER